MLVNQVELYTFVDRHNQMILILAAVTYHFVIALVIYRSASALSLEDKTVNEEICSKHTKNFNEASRNILHADFDGRRRSS